MAWGNNNGDFDFLPNPDAWKGDSVGGEYDWNDGEAPAQPDFCPPGGDVGWDVGDTLEFDPEQRVDGIPCNTKDKLVRDLYFEEGIVICFVQKGQVFAPFINTCKAIPTSEGRGPQILGAENGTLVFSGKPRDDNGQQWFYFGIDCGVGGCKLYPKDSDD